MHRAPGMTIVAVALIAVGCAERTLHGVKRVHEIRGIAALEVGSASIEVKQAAGGEARGLKLAYNGGYTDRAAVPLGGTFTLLDGAQRLVRYHVLNLDEDTVVLKEEERFDGRPRGEPVRQSERIIAVKSYGRELQGVGP